MESVVLPLFDSAMTIRLTLAILHFLWVACAIAMVAAAASWRLRRSSAQSRYVVHVAALGAMLTSLPVLFAIMSSDSVSSDSVSSSSLVRVAASEPAGSTSGEATFANSGSTLDSRHTAEVDKVLPAQNKKNSDRLFAHAENGQSDANGDQAREPRVFFSLIATLAPYISAAYLVGVFVMFGRVVIAMWSGRRLRTEAAVTKDETLVAMVCRLSQRLGVKTAPLVGWCHRITVPVVVGILRPMVLLPASMATGLDASQWEALLAHELAHVRRYDLLVNLLQRLIEAALFFHPAVWYVSRCASMERESACDDLVLDSGWPRMTYVESLLRMAELQLASRGASTSGHAGLLAAAGETPSQFKRRLLRLVGHEQPPRLALTPASVMGLALALLVVVVTPFVVPTFAGKNAHEEIELVDDQQSAAPNDNATQNNNQSADLKNPRKAAEDVARNLTDEKFAEVARLFSPELAGELSADKLADIWKRISKIAGELRRVRESEVPRVGNQRVFEASVRWEDAELTLGLLFDESGKIAGLRIRDNQRGGSIPEEVLPKGGVQFGPKLLRLVRATVSITVITQDSAGVEIESAVPSLWKEVPVANAGAEAWKPSDGTAWVRLDSMSAGKRSRFENLSAGRYRVSSSQRLADGSRSGYSAPMELASDQSQLEATTQIQAGGRFEFRLVFETGGKPVTDGWCNITRVTHDWPESGFAPKSQSETGTWSVSGVPSGRYKVTGGKRANSPEDFVFELATGPVELDAPREGETTQKELSLRGRPLTEQELLSRWPWIVEGTVRDAAGSPIPNVEMSASAGWGSLRVTGVARTDAEGRYRLRFGRGMMFSHDEPDPLDIQAAIIHAQLPGHYDKSLGKQAHLLAANRMPKPDELKNWGDGYYRVERIIVEGKPRQIDFVMAPASNWKVQLVDAQNQPIVGWHISVKGKILPPGSSVLESHKTDEQGRALFTDIPCDYEWRFVIEEPESRHSDISPLVRFKTAGEYDFVLRRETHEPTGLTLLEFKSIRDKDGSDRSAEVLVPDPRTARPVSAELQVEARQLLKRVGEVNHDWLMGPPDTVKKYSFLFTRPEQAPRRIEVDPRDPKNWTDIRGTAYVPAVSLLVAQADQIIFRQVEHRDGSIYVSYVIRQNAPPMRMHYGIGVAGKYGPYTSSGFREGTLKIDERTAIVHEHRTGELSEEFSEYAPTRNGRLVPLRIRILTNEAVVHDWRFKLYDQQLWLLDQAKNDKGQELARVSEVQILGP